MGKTRTKNAEIGEEVKKLEEKPGIGTWEVVRKDRFTPAPNSRKWSDETYRILGYKPGEVEPSDELFYALTHPEDAPLLKAALERVIESSSSGNVVVRMTRRDGRRIVVHITGSSEYYLGSDQWVKITGTIRDVTGRMQPERGQLSHVTRYNTRPTGYKETTDLVRFSTAPGTPTSIAAGQPKSDAIRTTEKKDPEYEKMYFPELSEKLSAAQWHLVQSQRIAHIGSWEIILKSLDNVVPGSLKWSDETYRIFGYQPEQVPLTPDFAFSHVHPSDFDMVVEAYRMAIDTCTGCNLEYRIIRKNGTEAIIHAIGECEYYSGSDSWVKITGTLQDITARKQAEKNEASLNSIFDNTSLSYVVTDEQLNIVSYNQAAFNNMKKELGVEFKEGASIINYTLPERKAAFKKLCISVLEGEKYSFPVDVPKRDGSTNWYVSNLFPIRLKSGKIVGMAISMEDITERKKVAAAQRNSEAQYRAFFDNSMDGILISQPDGKINAANPAACQMFRMTEEEICAAGRHGLMDKDHPNSVRLLQERQRTGSAKGEVSFRRKDGTNFLAILSTVVYKDANGEDRISAIIHDLTDTRTKGGQQIA